MSIREVGFGGLSFCRTFATRRCFLILQGFCLFCKDLEGGYNDKP